MASFSPALVYIDVEENFHDQLIEQVRSRSYLYDFSLQGYKDSAMKRDAWRIIGLELGKPGRLTCT